MFTVTNLLEIVQAAGDTLVAIGVESIEVYAGTAIDTAVYLAAVKDALTVCVHDARSRSAVGIHEVRACISGIIRTLGIAVTQRGLQHRECWHRLAGTAELALTVVVCGLDGSTDLGDSFGVGFGDDQTDRVFGRTAVDGLRFPGIHIAPASVRTGYYLHRVLILRHISPMTLITGLNGDF